MSDTTADRRSADRRRTAGHRLDVILDVTRRLMSVTDLDSLLQLIAEATRELLAADRATIFIVDGERGELWSRVALGTSEIRIPLGTGIAGTVAQTGEIINIPDAYADPRFNPEPDQQSGYQTKSLLTFPMTGQEGRVIGVFQAVNKHGGGPFISSDEDTLASLAASAAVAVEKGPARRIVLGRNQYAQQLDVIVAEHDGVIAGPHVGAVGAARRDGETEPIPVFGGGVEVFHGHDGMVDSGDAFDRHACTALLFIGRVS